MKKTTLCICLLFFASFAFAQKNNTKPPSSKIDTADMNKMMQEMQKQLNQMDPDAKRMMDSMGIKIPSLGNIPDKSTLESMQKKAEDYSIQSKKNLALAIQSIPRKTLTNEQLTIYLKTSFSEVEKAISAKAKDGAIKTYTSCKNKGMDNDAIANTALGISLQKGTQEALWILIKLSIDDNSNRNILNSFAGLASLCGGGQISIPILQKLNYDEPYNSTILNNLGQAWYSLNVKDSAKIYLRKAIDKSPFHSSANYTMALIAQEEGKKDTVLACMRRSSKYVFTTEKEKIIEKIAKEEANSAKQLNQNDIVFNGNKEKDPLHLSNYVLPVYSESVDDYEQTKANWEQFVRACNNEIASLNVQSKQLMDKSTSNMQKMIQDAQNGNIQVPPFADKAGFYYGKFIMDMAKDQKHNELILTEAQAKGTKIANIHDYYKRLYDDLDREYGDREGEGHAAAMKAYCEKAINITNSYLREVNNAIKLTNNEYMDYFITLYGYETNLRRYSASNDDEFKLFQLQTKISYLDMIKKLAHYENKSCRDDNKVAGEYNLVNSATAGCDQIFGIGIGIMSVSIDCQHITIEGGEGIVGGIDGNYATGDIELYGGVGVGGKIGAGVLNAELSAREMVFLNFNASGKNIKLNDLGVRGDVIASAGMLSSTQGKAEININGKWGFVSRTTSASVSTTLFGNVTQIANLKNSY